MKRKRACDATELLAVVDLAAELIGEKRDDGGLVGGQHRGVRVVLGVGLGQPNCC